MTQLRNIWNKIGLILAGVLAITSCFLPLRSVDGEGFGSFSQDESGVTVIGASVIIIVATSLSILVKKRFVAVIAGIVSIFCSLVIAFIAKLGYDAVNNSYLVTDMGIGCVLMIVAAILTFVFSILVLAIKPKE